MVYGERFNTYSHLFGLLVVLGGAGLLLAQAAREASGTMVMGVALFGLCSVALYAASILCHGSRGRLKAWSQRADHGAIYLMIAGTYTPFALAGWSGSADTALLATIWLVALAGALREMAGARQPLLWLYIGMGWLCVLGAVSLAPRLGVASTSWLLGGAAFYTVGTFFYANRWGWRHAHGTWHLFVLAGTASHDVALAFHLKLLPGG